MGNNAFIVYVCTFVYVYTLKCTKQNLKGIPHGLILSFFALRILYDVNLQTKNIFYDTHTKKKQTKSHLNI